MKRWSKILLSESSRTNLEVGQIEFITEVVRSVSRLRMITNEDGRIASVRIGRWRVHSIVHAVSEVTVQLIVDRDVFDVPIPIDDLGLKTAEEKRTFDFKERRFVSPHADGNISSFVQPIQLQRGQTILTRRFVRHARAGVQIQFVLFRLALASVDVVPEQILHVQHATRIVREKNLVLLFRCSTFSSHSRTSTQRDEKRVFRIRRDFLGRFQR